MTPAAPRPWHALPLSCILWAFARHTVWLPRVRAWHTDLRLVAKVIRRGWVQMLRDTHGPAAFITRDGARIHALYVHPRAQRRGMGRALIDHAKCHSPRLELWVAQANLPARHFYAAQGFAEVARSAGTGNDENLPDILMVWHSPGGMTR